MTQARSSLSPTQALTLLRTIWVTSLVSCLLLAGLAAVILWLWRIGPFTTTAWTFTGAGILSLLVLTFVGHQWQMRQYKTHWIEQRVTPAGYIGGNIALFLCHEITIAISILGVIASGIWLPTIIPGILAFMLHALAYPHGKPMRNDA